MALTEKIRLALEAQNFNKLFEDHEQIWNDLANEARNVMKPHVRNESPTVDDIKKVLLPLIEVNKHYRKFVEGNSRTRQLFWADRFTDYVLDRVYQPSLKVPAKAKKKENGND
jgi:hypothetical protein